MSILGRVTNGVVVLPPGSSFPEGTEVQVEAISPVCADKGFTHALEQIAKGGKDGGADANGLGLPDDLAANHDYYLHGHSHKQQPRNGRWIDDREKIDPLTAAETAREATQLAEMAAETSGLPADLSTNLDHYLYGLPRK